MNGSAARHTVSHEPDPPRASGVASLRDLSQVVPDDRDRASRLRSQESPSREVGAGSAPGDRCAHGQGTGGGDRGRYPSGTDDRARRSHQRFGAARDRQSRAWPRGGRVRCPRSSCWLDCRAPDAGRGDLRDGRKRAGTDGRGHEEARIRFRLTELDRAIEAVLAVKAVESCWLALRCRLGRSRLRQLSGRDRSHDHRDDADPAASRRCVTRLGLGGGRAVPSGDWTTELPELASQIDESLDDACATLRYPRPLVVLSPGLAIVEHDAA